MLFCTKCNKEYVSADNICPHCKESLPDNTINESIDLVNQNKKPKKLKPIMFVFLLGVLIACLLIYYINNKSEPQNYFQDKPATVSKNIPKKDVSKTENEKNKSSEVVFSIGKINEKTYTNEYFKFGCTLGTEWKYSDQNELFSEYIGSDGTTKIDSETNSIIEAIKKAGMYVDMHADGDSISSVNVVVEYNEESVSYSSEKALLKKINSEMKSYYQGMNTSVSMCEVELVPFGNESKYALHTSLSFNGTDFETYQYVFIINNYSAILTLSADSTEKLNLIAKMFYYFTIIY